MNYLIIEIMHAFWLPIILLFIAIFCLVKLFHIHEIEKDKIVFGVIIGIIFGFVADISKDGIDNLRNKLILRNASVKLLKEDAKQLYKIVWMFKKTTDNPEVKELIKKDGYIPPALDLNYWETLKKDHDFLMLANDKYFNDIFRQFWEFDKVNDQILLAKQGNRQAMIHSQQFIEYTINNNLHEKLLLLFMSSKEIDDYKRELSLIFK